MRREKTQNSKMKNEKWEITTPRKSREMSQTPFRTYIQINWKILKKWTNS
jgi:DNA-binding transcriptional regulator YiaG